MEYMAGKSDFMNLYVIGVNYKSTPVQIREKFSVDRQEYENILSSMKSLEGVSECSLLSTCNRTEIYIFSESPLKDTGYIEAHFCSLKGLDIYRVKKYFYVYEGINAMRHIFKVASGMDSMILGEDQILGQFKTACQIAMKEGTSKAVLNTLSRLAITSSKKIRTRNLELGRISSTAGRVGVFLADVFGHELAGRNYLVIGSGEVGSAVLKELLRLGAVNVQITKRSKPGVADIIENNFNIRQISYNDRYSFIDSCDVIISATSSPHYTITGDIFEKEVYDKRRKRIFIDLAVPRDIDEALGLMENVSLYNIDDLKSHTFKNKNGCQLDLGYIQEQINCHMDEFIRWYSCRKACHTATSGLLINSF